VSLVRRLQRRIGRRGAALTWFAILDLVFGLSLLSPPTSTQATATYHYVIALGGFRLWGLVWLAVGAVCAAHVAARRDRLAFACAILLKVSWGLLFLAAWLVDGAPRAWVSATIWLSFAAFVALLSGWPEADE
jgi:hypothetical protein